jgi:hypothetical protein
LYERGKAGAFAFGLFLGADPLFTLDPNSITFQPQAILYTP